MAHFRECLVRGGRAYIDAGDVAAVIVRGDDFDTIKGPDEPIRLLLSGCGDTVDIFAASIQNIFFDWEWLNDEKFQRLRVKGGHVFVHARHIVGLQMSGDVDTVAADEKHPLHLLVRGASAPLAVWGMSAFDLLFWMQSAGREVKVSYHDRKPAADAPAPSSSKSRARVRA